MQTFTPFSGKWLWESPEWPKLRYDVVRVLRAERAATRAVFELRGVTKFFDRATAIELTGANLEETALTTSRIEGELLARESVRASVRKVLGLDVSGLQSPKDRELGVVEMLQDATANHDRPLTKERLCHWQRGLFETLAELGEWRASGEMRVVSEDKRGDEQVHFVAPPFGRVPAEMEAFLTWANRVPEDGYLIHGGLAHLYFLTIHPFQDGNGRVARAVLDMMLARNDGSRERFFSLTAVIQRNKEEYYERLEEAQRGDGDVTAWLVWYLERVRLACELALIHLDGVGRRARFWLANEAKPLSKSQRKVLGKMLETGFEGVMNSSKYRSIADVSKSTAVKELAELAEWGCLAQKIKAGRNASYELIRQ